jgi:hypothetical protein
MHTRVVQAPIALLTCVAIGCFAGWAAAQDDRPRVEYREKVTNFFGGADAALHFEVHVTKPAKGRVSWQLQAGERSDTVGGLRKVASRELEVEIKTKQPATIEIKHKLPPVKEGVVFPLKLTVAFVSEGETTPAAEWKETLWLYPESPFTDRNEWLDSLKIHLFDPEGTTAAALKKLEVPFTPVRNLAAVADVKPGILIVGENVSWARSAISPRRRWSSPSKARPSSASPPPMARCHCRSPRPTTSRLPVIFAFGEQTSLKSWTSGSAIRPGLLASRWSRGS